MSGNFKKENICFDPRTLRSIAGGDKEAFGNVFRMYHARVYRLALKYLRSKELAEEVVQDIFLNLWLNRERLSRIESFQSYLFISTRNAALAAIKKMLTTRSYEMEYASMRNTVDDTTDHGILDGQYKELIRQAMEYLPPQQREVFRLSKEIGLSLDDVADEMKISRLTVKKHLVNAMKTMREHLQPHVSFSVMLISMLYAH